MCLRCTKWAILLVVLCAAARAFAEQSEKPLVLEAVSGADGEFKAQQRDGKTWLTAAPADDGFANYMYFRVPAEVRSVSEVVYLEVELLDTGRGNLGVQYNSSKQGQPYAAAEESFDTELTGSGRTCRAIFKLQTPKFQQAQNLKCDLRISPANVKTQLTVLEARIFTKPPARYLALADEPWLRAYDGPSRDDIDTKTLRRKVLCGYQGWFRAPGDGTGRGWVHWSRNGARIAPDTLTFEMWPDMSELGDDEKFPAEGFTYPDGSPAHLFSSAHPQTVERHFQQMKEYGIDGAFLQRFLVGKDERAGKMVLANVRAAAHTSGRAFAITYDMSGMPAEMLFDALTNDWKWLVDDVKITKDSRYLHDNGKPVLMVYGFFTDRFEAELAHRIIDFFKTKGPYEVSLIGGCQWQWRTAAEREWAAAFRRFDVIMPWNVGNTTKKGEFTLAATEQWVQDRVEAKRAGLAFMPVVYPGFSWDNLQQKQPGSTNIPRLKGNFYWQQFRDATLVQADTIYVAMFDEVDEGTAIFKVTNEPPKQAHFVTYEGLPSDWYLRLTGEATKQFRAGRRFPAQIPIKPRR